MAKRKTGQRTKSGRLKNRATPFDYGADDGRVGFAETGSTRFAPQAPTGLGPSGDDPARGKRFYWRFERGAWVVEWA